MHTHCHSLCTQLLDGDGLGRGSVADSLCKGTLASLTRLDPSSIMTLLTIITGGSRCYILLLRRRCSSKGRSKRC